MEIASISEIKLKLEELISFLKLTAFKKIGKLAGYSHSNACGVLKHKK